jgi:curved DNA-binding protein CbpA
MGNESSSLNGTTNKSMDDLQKQILENQLEIQRIQINNLQSNNSSSNNNLNNTPTNSINLAAIFSNPQLQQEIGKNPQKKIALLENILNNHSSSLSPQHRVKINQMLLETKREFQQNQRQNFMQTNIGTQKQHRSKMEIAQSRRQDAITREGLSKNYSSEAEEEEARYKIEEDKRRHLFYEKQRQRRFEYEAKLKQLSVDNVNSLRLFNLNENFTMDELKKAYRKIALRTHPDRPGGNKEKFQLVTTCYFSLMENLKMRSQDKTFDRLRNDSRDYFDEQNRLSQKYRSGDKKQSPLFNKDDKQFNGKMFNKVFEENKLYDPNEEGYDDWLKNEDDTPAPKVFSNKFNIDVFNNTFNDYKDTSTSQEMVEYKEPQALVSCNKMQYTDIDQSKKQNYTKSAETSNELGYSDLKSAYTKTNNLVNPNNVKIKQYRNIDELEHDRSNISFELSPEQLRQQAIQQQQEEEEEYRRQQRIQQRDYMTENHYNDMHMKMIGN